jgi:hypothetical protein
MAARYLDWLTELFDEAQVPYTAESAAWLDVALRRIAAQPAGASEEAVYRALRERWLNQGQPGRQLLASFLRDEVFARRDSPMRPKEGEAYYTNAWASANVKG